MQLVDAALGANRNQVPMPVQRWEKVANPVPVI